jgi:predicted metal-binding protein
LINTSASSADAELWMKSDKPDEDMVYLLECWVNDKLVPGCSYNSYNKFTHTFQTKWVWDKDEGWHNTDYVHKSERA